MLFSAGEELQTLIHRAAMGWDVNSCMHVTGNYSYNYYHFFSHVFQGLFTCIWGLFICVQIQLKPITYVDSIDSVHMRRLYYIYMYAARK